MGDNVFYLEEEGKLPILVVLDPSAQTWDDKGMKARYAVLYDAAAPISEDEDW